MRVHPGARIASYELLSLAGHEGLGEVWKARHALTGRSAAVRLLPILTGQHRPAVSFERDLRVLAALNHRGFPAVFDVIEREDLCAIADEWVEAPSLTARIRDDAMTSDRALRIAAQIADALGAAHRHAVVHGNLTPHNVRVSPSGMVKVLDCGLARALQQAAPHLPDVRRWSSAGNVLIGTPAYMSPEQLAGRAPTVADDVWAFGCLLFELLARQPAFAHIELTEPARLVRGVEPQWTRLPAATAPAVVPIIRQCLDNDADARFFDLSALSMTEQTAAHETAAEESSEHLTLKRLAQEHRDNVAGEMMAHFVEMRHRVQRWVRGRVPGYLEVSDEAILQQAFDQAIVRLHEFAPNQLSALQAYMRQIVISVIRDEIRRYHRKRSIL